MNAKKAAPKAPADKVALYEKLLATHPKIERKGATMPYTSLNGNMFSLLAPSGELILRLSESEREAFAKEVQDCSARHVWGRDEGIRGGPGCAAQENQRVEEVSGS